MTHPSRKILDEDDIDDRTVMEIVREDQIIFTQAELATQGNLELPDITNVQIETEVIITELLNDKPYAEGRVIQINDKFDEQSLIKITKDESIMIIQVGSTIQEKFGLSKDTNIPDEV